jgi:hypothetical protein
MATKDSNIQYDIKFFDFLWSYTEESKMYGSKFKAYHKRLLLKGEIQISTMAENVMAYNSDGLYVKASGDGMDFSDESDAKTCSVTTNSNKTAGLRLTAIVRGIGNKIGTLRVICYNRFNGKFYFFVIPHSVYNHLKDTLDIPFDINTHELKPNWKYIECQVSTFKELCT